MAAGGYDVEMDHLDPDYEDKDPSKVDEGEDYTDRDEFDEHDESFRLGHFNRTIENESFEDEVKNEVKRDEIETKDFIKSVYEKSDFSKIEVFKDEKGDYWVSLKRKNKVWFKVTDDGVDETASKTLKKALGKRDVDSLRNISDDISKEEEKLSEMNVKQKENEDYRRKLEEEMNRSRNLERQLRMNEERLDEYHNENTRLKEKLRKSTSLQERKDLESGLKENNMLINGKLKDIKMIKDQQNHIDDLENELEENKKENINLKKIIDEINKTLYELNIKHEEKFSEMSLKKQVKYIFKKHGLTILGITSVITTVVAAIVSNLTNGLGKVTNTVGKGLKKIGKQIAQILPGMIGAIASFIFKTAGEVFGFLGKNAWLLILFLVTYAVEQYNKK